MSSSRRQYPFHLIEPKWQQIWDEQQAFRAFNPGEVVPEQHPFGIRHGLSGQVAATQLPPKYYILDMFPYPSGAGLHVGHPEGYTATDILARYKRAQGFNVLHPMGWDSFGLPAEQYAVKTGQHPRVTTETNIKNFTRQIKSLGFSYDWSRELATTDADYFKWTQWIFLKLYNSWFNPDTQKAESVEILDDVMSENPEHSLIKGEYGQYLSGLHNGFIATPAEDRATYKRNQINEHRLAYVANAEFWWCEQLGTVLSNEEVVDGKSEVGGFPAVKKPMRQWVLRITAYAERLFNDLDTIDWSSSLKEMQRNWIGRSEGATIKFQADIPDPNRVFFRVFTTRPDTLFGTTYLVVAPEHQLVELILQAAKKSYRVNEQITASEVRLFGENMPPGTIPIAEALAMAKAKKLDLIELNPDLNRKVCIFDDFKRYHEYQQEVSRQADAIRNYQQKVASKSDLERAELSKEKTGVFTGAYATNPVNGKKIPIWIADYVLSNYGTGAIMAVPAHDTRDFEFAQKFNLPVVQVVQPNDTKKEWQGFTDDGTAVNSGFLDGLPTAEAKKKITAWLEEKGLGKKTVNFKLRDWLFSRQRYWGEPFPIIWKRDAAGNLQHEALPESALPVLPPSLTDYKPTATGEPPLARAKDWVNLPDGAIRETNTMPQWAGSCWYYLRYLDTKNENAFVGKDVENYWMNSDSSKLKVESCKLDVSTPQPATSNQQPATKSTTTGVDLYVGGTEHAVLHLLYARFWHKVLFDLGFVSTAEPFFKLVNQGLILGEDGQKMSKSRGNVVNPDDVLGEYGADAFRLYEMFMGPLEMVKPWNTKGVEGVYRFLGRAWRLFVDEKSETDYEQAETLTTKGQSHQELLNLIKLNTAVKDVAPTPAQLKTLHTCIKKVTEDLDGMRFNTAISAMMMFVNDAIAWETKPVSVLREFLILLQPFAPHIAEELWAKLNGQFQISDLKSKIAPNYQPWPEYNPELLVESEIEIPVQVNGKLRTVIKVSATATQAELEALAKDSAEVKPFTDGKTIKKIIVVPKKLVNIVAV